MSSRDGSAFWNAGGGNGNGGYDDGDVPPTGHWVQVPIMGPNPEYTNLSDSIQEIDDKLLNYNADLEAKNEEKKNLEDEQLKVGDLQKAVDSLLPNTAYIEGTLGQIGVVLQNSALIDGEVQGAVQNDQLLNNFGNFNKEMSYCKEEYAHAMSSISNDLEVVNGEISKLDILIGYLKIERYNLDMTLHNTPKEIIIGYENEWQSY